MTDDSLVKQIRQLWWAHHKTGEVPTQIYMSPNTHDKLIYECHEIICVNQGGSFVTKIYGMEIKPTAGMADNTFCIIS